MPTNRIAYCYHFKVGNKIVEVGVTGDIVRKGYRLRRKSGWEKGRIKQIGIRTTVAYARAWEAAEAKKRQWRSGLRH